MSNLYRAKDNHMESTFIKLREIIIQKSDVEDQLKDSKEIVRR